jgi:hypothetical protein
MMASPRLEIKARDRLHGTQDAAAFVFLAARSCSRYITGEILPIIGGCAAQLEPPPRSHRTVVVYFSPWPRPHSRVFKRFYYAGPLRFRLFLGNESPAGVFPLEPLGGLEGGHAMDENDKQAARREELQASIGLGLRERRRSHSLSASPSF